MRFIPPLSSSGLRATETTSWWQWVAEFVQESMDRRRKDFTVRRAGACGRGETVWRFCVVFSALCVPLPGACLLHPSQAPVACLSSRCEDHNSLPDHYERRN